MNITDSYYTLTSCLHNIRAERSGNLRRTTDIAVFQVVEIFRKILPHLDVSALQDVNAPWVALLEGEAENISADENLDEVRLENKVLLAMYIRLKAEAFMEEELECKYGQGFFTSGSNRFGALYDKYRKFANGADENQLLLARVSLMTPEHIHMNSFMYEPLVDMTIDSLLALYKDVMTAWPQTVSK